MNDGSLKNNLFYNVLIVHGAELADAKKADMLVRAIVSLYQNREEFAEGEKTPLDEFVSGMTELSNNADAPLKELEEAYGHSGNSYSYYRHRSGLLNECMRDARRLLDIYERLMDITEAAMKVFDNARNTQAAGLMEDAGALIGEEREALQDRLEGLEETKEENDIILENLAEGQKDMYPDEEKAWVAACYETMLTGNSFKRIFIYSLLSGNSRKEALVDELLADAEDKENPFEHLFAFQSFLHHENGVEGLKVYEVTDPAKEGMKPQRIAMAYNDRLEKLSQTLKIYEELTEAAQEAHRVLAVDDEDRAAVMAVVIGGLQDLCTDTARMHESVRALKDKNRAENGPSPRDFAAARVQGARPPQI